MRITYIVFLMVLHLSVFSQDTIQMMQYNLLNYRNSTNECNGTTNNANLKDENLKLIVKAIKPDLIACNEMGSNIANANRILENALNVDGINYFEQAQFSNNDFSSLTNMLFYNKDKFGLKGQDILSKDNQNSDLVRVIDIYKLFYIKSAFPGSDTLFLNVIVGHLKAGNTNNDALDREKMTGAIMEYLARQPKRFNYILAGDLNVQTSSENSFKNLISHSQAELRFYDPMEALGNWNNNGNYANVHTQSTHSSSSNSCFSSGGMDDRYDFILVSKEIKDNLQGISFIPNSYKAFGNDGGRFNSDINGSSNKLLSKTLLDALYNMSDHLPVIAQFALLPKSNRIQKYTRENFRVVAPFANEIIVVNANAHSEEYKMSLRDMTGKLIFEKKLNFINGVLTQDVSQIKSGFYTLTLSSNQNEVFHFRLLKLETLNP